jgi:AcrR family transcriptional regulator
MPQPARKLVASRRQRSSTPSDSVSADTPKLSQRERLVDAMIELSARAGYQRVSIAQVSAQAGVSSATFYEQFEDKEDCLLAAYRSTAERVLGQVRLAGGRDWSAPARDALGQLLGGLWSNPDAGRVLLVEARAAGPRVRRERERALAGFERRIEARLGAAASDGQTLDIPAEALVGAVRSIALRHLRTDAEDELPPLVEDLLTWIGSYAIPGGRERWSAGCYALLPPAPGLDVSPPAPATAPARLPRGRHGLPPGVIARSQRTRIIYGTAEVMMAKGYANATVADIVAAAGVARDVFYSHFDDKLHAFLEAQRYSTQEVLDACAAAYFSADEWPQRIWNGLHTLLALTISHPSLAHLRLVECYAAGPDALSRTEDITRSFTVFLEEGYRYRPEASALPRVCSQAIVGAVFEAIYRQIARGDVANLARQLPLLAYIALAPFTGPQDAIALVTRMSARRAIVAA